MTARQIFEATLIELSKVQAPSLKLYEFNYLFNKAINQYVNKIYNIYDINQQTTDDLRVLKSTAYLTPRKVELGKSTTDSALKNLSSSGKVESTGNQDEPREGYTGQASSYLSKANRSIQSLHGATYEIYLPMDYLHMLNCVCIYYVAKQKDCWDAGSYIEVPAYRLTADSWSQIINDIYNRPSPMKPYYYIHNINQYQSLPTDPNYNISGKNGAGVGTDMNGLYEVTSSDGGEMEEGEAQKSNFQRTFKINEYNEGGTEGTPVQVSLVEKPTALRAGNTSNVRCEIRYGKKLNRKYSRFAHYNSNIIVARGENGEG